VLRAVKFKLAQVIASEKGFVKLLRPNPCESSFPEVQFFLVVQHDCSLGQLDKFRVLENAHEVIVGHWQPWSFKRERLL
jgi:hypothetical protein